MKTVSLEMTVYSEVQLHNYNNYDNLCKSQKLMKCNQSQYSEIIFDFFPAQFLQLVHLPEFVILLTAVKNQLNTNYIMFYQMQNLQ